MNSVFPGDVFRRRANAERFYVWQILDAGRLVLRSFESDTVERFGRPCHLELAQSELAVGFVLEQRNDLRRAIAARSGR